MVIFSFLNVVLRALYTKFNLQFANSLLTNVDWSEPFARLMVLWITFLGASLLTKNNRHIRIDIMGHFLSPFLLSIRELVLSMACAAICFFMVRASIGYISMEIEYGTSSVMGVAAWKWQIILRADNVHVPLPRLVASYLVGTFFNIFLPSSIGGDAYRIYDVARDSGRSASSFSSVLADRLSGFLALARCIP